MTSANLREKQEGNTLRDVTSSYFTQKQQFTDSIKFYMGCFYVKKL